MELFIGLIFIVAVGFPVIKFLLYLVPDNDITWDDIT